MLDARSKVEHANSNETSVFKAILKKTRDKYIERLWN